MQKLKYYLKSWVREGFLIAVVLAGVLAFRSSELVIRDGWVEINGRPVDLKTLDGPHLGPMDEPAATTFREQLGSASYIVQRLPHSDDGKGVQRIRVPAGM